MIRTVIGVVILILSSSVDLDAQSRKVRVAMPGYTIAGLSFLTAKLNGYYAGEGLDVELIAMRAPTANLAVLSGSVEFSTVPLAGLNTALRGGALKVIMVHFDKPQHVLFVKKELQNLQLLRGKKLAVSGPGVIESCKSAVRRSSIGSIIVTDRCFVAGIKRSSLRRKSIFYRWSAIFIKIHWAPA